MNQFLDEITAQHAFAVWVLIILAALGPINASAQTVVLPNSSADVDAGGSSGSSVLRDVFHLQEVYGAANLPPGPIVIREIRFRPSAVFGQAFSATISNIRITLSTTAVQPGQLNPTFAVNHGTNKTVVVDGAVNLSSSFSGPVGGPKAFDIVIPVTTPFIYNSAEGNLLVDIQNFSGSTATFVDIGYGASAQVSRQYAFDGNATVASLAGDSADVLQISYEPVPTAPYVFTQPRSQRAFVGGSATLTVTAGGASPLAYQWRFGGADLLDATNTSLTMTNLAPSQSGTYSVLITNALGSIESTGAVLTVTNRGELTVSTLFAETEGGDGSSVLTNAIRLQEVYGASMFPSAPLLIREIRFRPSSVYGRAFDASIQDLQVNLSTTTVEPEHLNASFAANAGTDDTMVFRGSIRLSSSFTGPAGQPKNFDIIIPLAAPFLYDPSVGNLLVDFRNYSGSGSTFVDVGNAPGDQASRCYALGAHSTQATSVNAAADVLQLSYTVGDPPLPPTITRQPRSTTNVTTTTATFTVGAGGARPLAYQWRFHGDPIPDATNSTLVRTNVQYSDAGEYSVQVTNVAGAAISDEAVLTVVPSRTLRLRRPEPQQEGTTIELAVELVSEGDVGGMTFDLFYNPSYLEVMNWNWVGPFDGAFNQASFFASDQIRATFALPAIAAPAGTQLVAFATIRLRSVPSTLDSLLTLNIADVSSPLGDAITLGNLAQGTTAHINQRSIVGDNNANQRLDIGDATVILRLIAGLEIARSWDRTGNDLNQNGSLETGDAIRVLRAAAGLDPQPGAGGAGGALFLRPSTTTESMFVSPSMPHGSGGELVTVQVQMQNVQTTVSGAAFTLDYPTNALRLLNAQAFRAGSIIPGNALAVWNTAPAQNNFVTQNGHLTFAASSATPWAASNGVLAEITFQVQSGATNQYGWPLVLRGSEITPDGFGNRFLSSSGATFKGRNAVPGSLSGVSRNPAGQFQFTLNGDAGAGYVVEASTNLMDWTSMVTLTNDTGALEFTDSESTDFKQRFYRARPSGN